VHPTEPTRTHLPASREALWLSLLLAAGLLARLAFVIAFPIQPVSDFRGLVDFGLFMRDHSVVTGGYFWRFFNPGLPLVLSLIFRIVPGSPETAARLATAVATGLVPALPFTLWRGVLPFRIRLLAGGALALWPGQIVFSGVVAQDNWVLLPVVALAALAVRSLLAGRGHPAVAGLLYAAGVAIRQEMLIALLPLLAAAALGSWRTESRRRALLAGLLAAGIPLLLLAFQRQAATGRFALTTDHGGLSLLGSYVPGATANAWADPLPYVAAVEPELLERPAELKRQAVRLALQAARARPAFHAARITAFTLDFAVRSEVYNLYWCLLVPEGLPPARALELARRVPPVLQGEMTVLLALFLASLLLTPRRWSQPIWPLVAAMALKVGLHAVITAQGRYFLPVTALQILVISLAAENAGRVSRRGVMAALAVGGIVAAGASWLAPRAVGWVRAHDVDRPRVYRFPLSDLAADPKIFDCVVRRGRLVGLSETGAALQTFHPDPPAGETAAVECVSRSSLPVPPLLLRLPAAGQRSERVTVDGREVPVHDLALVPGSGGIEVPLGEPAPGKRKTFSIELATGETISFQLVRAGR
jgi:hypothetical protein